jgi:hypothetical protein
VLNPVRSTYPTQLLAVGPEKAKARMRETVGWSLADDSRVRHDGLCISARLVTIPYPISQPSIPIQF